MAKVIVRREWPDGECLHIEVSVATSYPDAVCEARANARGLYADALEVTIASDAAAADEDDGA